MAGRLLPPALTQAQVTPEAVSGAYKWHNCRLSPTCNRVGNNRRVSTHAVAAPPPARGAKKQQSPAWEGVSLGGGDLVEVPSWSAATRKPLSTRRGAGPRWEDEPPLPRQSLRPTSAPSSASFRRQSGSYNRDDLNQESFNKPLHTGESACITHLPAQNNLSYHLF